MIDDEFRFLPSDAQRVGRTTPTPAVERISTPVGGGRQLSGLRFGSPDAPQFDMLHGAGLNAHSFDPALLALDEPALSLDLPGHGRSDWRADADYRPDHLAAGVVPALEQSRRQRVGVRFETAGERFADRKAARSDDADAQWGHRSNRS